MGTLTRNQLDRNGRGRRRSGMGWRGLAALLAAVLAVLIATAVLVPVLGGGLLRGMAEDNPDLLRLPFVADAVRDHLGQRLDTPAGTDPTPVEFSVEAGTGSREITDQLVQRDLVTDKLAFTWVLLQEGAANKLQAGLHVLNRTMSPRQVAAVLQQPAVPVTPRTTIALRGGLRVEQVVAYLEDNRDDIAFDPADFYALAQQPPDDLIAEYSMLATKPAGRSLEGYLGFGVFEMASDTDARGLLEILLQRRQAELEPLLTAAPPRLLEDFYQVLTLASIVEAETGLDSERAVVAGVYLNRLDQAIWPTRLLNADPTVIYGNDTVRLNELSLPEWRGYVFWGSVGRPMGDVVLTDELAGFQTYHSRGLPPGPIRSPSVASINGVLNADTSAGYLYFVSKGDGSHAFARTWEEHLANVQKYQGGSTPTP